ncbi:prolipoprotein diacylglyceryl transferase [Rarobacter faecitabidus]|uniref:Phosphatidylglycerol--prolipoprotein diacylglyceryl transferase n=1 Tax=Rarobacter faecitabidus TaxID=13243 RepID=A0A542ZW00_RARFA|nr:prolipoprotein diacylglyceryl transferase [Rarobacter faecitabidus]TQL64416.1 prolipoprotein diacylglyceryl transferase [Rarobacter faecitabidus]
MTLAGATLAAIPSPSVSQWQLGPLTIRAYALCLLAGIVIAIWWTARRWQARGGNPDTIYSVSVWAVPLGIIGGRLYHVITSPGAYFGKGGDPVAILYIWHGGLGIWGAIALGAVGAWIGCRRAGISLAQFADVAAPPVLLAQAIGRWGNWFNQELFGGPTDAPWALKVSDHVAIAAGYAPGTTFHPTFLYESLWSLLGVIALIACERRLRLRTGQVFWLYVLIYTAGRLWIEMLRVDEATTVLGLRLNVWTSAIVLIGSIAAIIAIGRGRPKPVASEE